MEIHLGIHDVRMPQVGCKQRQGRSGVLTFSGDPIQVPRGKGVTKIMQPGIASLDRFDAQIPREGEKRIAYGIVDTPLCPLINEEGCLRPLVVPEGSPSDEVLRQACGRRTGQGNEPGLQEFAFSYKQK